MNEQHRKTKRVTGRLDYAQLHTKGRRVVSSNSQMSGTEDQSESDTMAEQLQSEEVTISEDVEDFLDENAVEDLGERL